jgi:Ca-activated chloride channel family protein
VNSFSEESDKSRAVIVITDGENHEGDAVAAARNAADNGVRVFTIGVGTRKGTMIPDPDGGYITDADGNNVVTHLDEESLVKIASAGNGAYVQANNVEFGLSPIVDEIQNMEDTVTTTITYEEYEELYMYFLAAALFFLILEILVGDRRSKIRLFKK